MKKIINILAVTVLGGLILSSCDNDDTTNDIATHGLEVTSAKTSFAAFGGTNSIMVATKPIAAYTNDSWATVAIDGNTVNVTATQNNDIQTRHASVVIKSSEADSAVVNIDQDGMVFNIANSSVTLQDAAMTKKVYVNHNLPVNVTTKVDWLSAAITDDSLAITATKNGTGQPRQGWVYYTSGNTTDSISVMQFTPEKDILGEYKMMYYLSEDNKRHYTGVSIVKEADGSYAMHFTDGDLADLGWSVPVTIRTDKPEFTFTNLSKIGEFQGKSVLWMVMVDDGEHVYYSKSTDVTATAAWTVDETGTPFWPVTQQGFNSSYEFYAFSLGLSSDGKTYDNNLGRVLDFVYAQFEKVTPESGSGAKASISRSLLMPARH